MKAYLKFNEAYQGNEFSQNTYQYCLFVSENFITTPAMEAVPKFPMLKFDVKLSPDNGDFLETIKKLIKVS